MSSNQPPVGPPDEPTRDADRPRGPQPGQSQPGQSQPGQQNPYGPPQQGGPDYDPQQGGPYGQPQQGGQQPGYGQSRPGGYGQAHPGDQQQYPQPGPYGQPQPGFYAQPPHGVPPYGTAQQGGYQQGGYQQGGYQQGGYQQGGYGPQPGNPGSSKLWLVAVLVIVLLVAIAGLVVGIVSLTGDDESGAAVNDLEAGQCVISDDIEEGEASIDSIETTACDKEHDGEVFATLTLTEETAKDFDIDAAGSRCVDELVESTGLTLEVLSSASREVRPLVADSEPAADDNIVCFIRHSGGEKLTEKIAE